jgi:chemotaxis family two-component system sensor kinase Cph1
MNGTIPTATNVDISNCDREPIHLAGAIQPHGALLVLTEPGLRIVQASANTGSFLGLPAEALLGQTAEALLGAANIATLRTHLDGADLNGTLDHLMRLPSLPHMDAPFHLYGNRMDGLLLLEFEQAVETGPTQEKDGFSQLREVIHNLQKAPSLRVFLNVAVERVRAFTGFERVMAYRFDADGSGEIVAEAKCAGLETYLGLHYPASDIPAPARRLFALSPLRHLPDVDYTPVPLLADPLSAAGGLPVDLSYSFMRSVSLMYTGYLRNMGVKATMVMPLLKDGTLWGLISCMNHTAPKYLSYERRAPVELLIQMLSMLMGNRESLDYYDYRRRLSQALEKLVSLLGQADDLREALLADNTNLLSAISASGAALIADGKLTLLGKTPTEDQVGLLTDWLSQQDTAVFSTHRLAHDFPACENFRSVASGLLTVRLFRKGSERVIWFRPEVLREVHWAGDPNKPVEISEINQEVRLQPRTSFALWKETVHGQSRPWLDCELDHASGLRQAIIDTFAKRAKVLALTNAELERSNQELDSFAYAASHDLREPLRGIHNFAEFLREEEGERLSERAIQRIETILRLSGRMDNMLESLLQYSRISKKELDLQTLSIADLVKQTAEFILQIIPEKNVAIKIQTALPEVRCDRVRVSMIFQNLIMNAIKYNDKAEKKIEIGCDASGASPVFYVRDNGIGIEQNQHELIFQLFRRLQGRDAYGGGSGAGLTIVKKAVDRHGGRIWVESQIGMGSTFYFTLTTMLEAEREYR